MGEEVNMVEYAGEEDRVMEWEYGLPCDEDLPPLSQVLIPQDLASAFNITPEPHCTTVDVNRASQNTLSSLRGKHPTFEDDRSKKLSRTESSIEEADSTVRGVENSNSNSVDEQSARSLKRPRLVWTSQLHKRFVDVVSHLGIKNAVPKTIMQLMNVEGLTRENVASHLQKYRLYVKRMQGLSNEGPSSSDQLFASTPVPQSLRESGHTNGHVPVQIQMPYPMLGMAPHQHGFGIAQQRSWSGNYNGFHHVAPGDN